MQLFKKKPKKEQNTISPAIDPPVEYIESPKLPSEYHNYSLEELKQKYPTEALFKVPALYNVPEQWCRSSLVTTVEKVIRSQAMQVFSLYIVIVILTAATGFASFTFAQLTGRSVESKKVETRKTLDIYGKEISAASSLNNILNYVHEISMADQLKGIMKISVESGIIMHHMLFNHNTNEIPENVKNNFETASGIKFDAVRVIGIWTMDCTFINVAPDTQSAYEDWLLNINQNLKNIYKPLNSNVFLDVSSKSVSGTLGSKDNKNRIELVVVFWKP